MHKSDIIIILKNGNPENSVPMLKGRSEAVGNRKSCPRLAYLQRRYSIQNSGYLCNEGDCYVFTLTTYEHILFKINSPKWTEFRLNLYFCCCTIINLNSANVTKRDCAARSTKRQRGG